MTWRIKNLGRLSIEGPEIVRLRLKYFESYYEVYEDLKARDGVAEYINDENCYAYILYDVKSRIQYDREVASGNTDAGIDPILTYNGLESLEH